MAPPFTKKEYAARVTKVRSAMQAAGFDILVIGDPANINWLTGYDAWSFYTPQVMVLGLQLEPTWLGRDMDAGAAGFTTYLKPEQVVPFPEGLVQQKDKHPAQFMGDWMRATGIDGKRIGYESDVYYLSPTAIHHLQTALPNSQWHDCELLVNWQRLVKSDAEIKMLKQAAEIAACAMTTAYEGTRPGVRQSSLMADVVASQIRGTDEFGGDMTALHPLVLAGEAASTAHPMWTDEAFKQDQTIAFELGGCRKRYNAGLARTMHIGTPPDKLVSTAAAVSEGMQAVLNSMKSGVLCSDVHAAWQSVLNRYGLEKKSRIGYSIGVGYAPDWGEHTISFRTDDQNALPENAVVHIILGMWMDGWGMELSETIHVRHSDAVCLTDFPRDVFVVD